MKSILVIVVLVCVHTTVVRSANYYRDVGQHDSCSVGEEKSECMVNQGTYGECRKDCQKNEVEAKGPHMCKDGCKCCTVFRSECSLIQMGGYCAPKNCEQGLQTIFLDNLCLPREGYVCCKEKGHGGVIHNHKENHHADGEGGEKGLGTHYYTFDGYKFQFSGLCTYVLTKERAENPSFYVHARHVMAAQTDRKLVAYVSALEIKNNEDIVELGVPLGAEEGKTVDVEVNNVPIDYREFPYERDGMKIDWGKNQKGIEVTLADKLTVDYNGKGKTSIKLHESQHGKVWGLLGDSNGIKHDDLTYKVGEDTYTLDMQPFPKMPKDDFNVFFDSWLVNCE